MLKKVFLLFLQGYLHGFLQRSVLEEILLIFLLDFFQAFPAFLSDFSEHSWTDVSRNVLWKPFETLFEDYSRYNLKISPMDSLHTSWRISSSMFATMSLAWYIFFPRICQKTNGAILQSFTKKFLQLLNYYSWIFSK